jgi:uncharacterized protein (TIGR02996 family)
MNEPTFLAAVLADPDDDVTRLAFADWLQEQDDPALRLRGEFVQIQVRIARHASGTSPGEWADAERLPELKRRERELIDAHGKTWATPFVGVIESYQFARGFVESISLEPTKFVAHAATLFAVAPLQKVRFTQPISLALVGSPSLAKVVELDLGASQMGDAGLSRLLGSRNLSGLRRLNLSQCYLTDRGIAGLAASPILAQLEALNLGYNYLGLPGVQALFQSPHWGKLRSLTLAGNHYIDARAQEYIALTLQGSADTSLLCAMLQTASREEREYTLARVRDLARRAGEADARATEILTEALHDGDRKVRSASAQMLSRLSEHGTVAVPQLVQRLFEDTLLVRDHAAPALARLLPDLSPDVQRWLCVLANPLLPARVDLRAAIDRGLPAGVATAFAELLGRRLRWWTRLLEENDVAAALPPESDAASLRHVSSLAITWAGRHTARHHHGEAKAHQQTRGGDREAAWLVARLVDLLMKEFPPEVGAPTTAKRGRRK